jgi:hypothetical protein
MTIATTTNKVIWQGNGATSVFSYSFLIPAPPEAVVTLTYTTAAGAQTVIGAGQYTITGLGNAAGGTVTYTNGGSPIPAGSTLTLQRIMPYVQDTSLTNQGGLWPSAIEQGGLDILEMQIQQLAEQISRAVLLNPASQGLSGVLPPASLATNQYLITDAYGNITLGSGVSNSAVVSSVMRAIVSASSTAAAALALGVVQIVTPQQYGAKGDGATDDSAAIQSAVNAALANGGLLFVPQTATGYKVSTCINLTNLTQPLTILGAAMNAPTFGQGVVPPQIGSILLGNTGTGKPVFDCCGSNNVLFRNININSIGQSTPSTIGILAGTSATSPVFATPGGANIGLENVAIYMPNVSNSIPMAFVGGAGLSHFHNVSTLGGYGLYFSTNNTLGIASPYVTIGAAAGVDGVSTVSCALLGYGTAPVLYIESCSCHEHVQLYVCNINSGPSYSGQPYPIYMNNVYDIRVKVEADYWPSLFTSYAGMELVNIEGIVFPNTTPTPSSVPVVGLFNSGAIMNCAFNVQPVTGVLPNTNYHYTSIGGTSPTLTTLNNVKMLYTTTTSTNVLYANCSNSLSVPFFNIQLSGNGDETIGGPISMFVNGSAASTSQYRIFVNGIKFGSA